MSKRIFIYRHAKSDWSAAYGSDHDRPLTSRGIKSAKIMGRMLGSSGQVPELVVTSTALRAKQTVEFSRLEGDWNCKLIENEKLYFESAEEIFQIIQSLSDKYSKVMLVGHEPKCSQLTALMIGGGEVIFKTATMARIDFNNDEWCSLHQGEGELIWLQNPSLLKKGKFNL